MANVPKIDSEKKIVLGIDVGTTNIRCYAYDKSSKVIGSCHEKMCILDYGDGRHEIEPDSLWNTFQRVVKKCLDSSQLTAKEITCLGISTQRASFTTWDRNTNETFHNFITWKDRRTEKLCNDWNSSLSMKMLRFGARLLYYITWRKIFQMASVFNFTPSMALTRLYWIIQHDNKVRDKISKNEALFGTTDTWLVWKLTGGEVHATDGSNACVTGFFDLFKMQWMNWMLNVLHIPADIFPVVKNTSDSFGQSLPELFGASIPICALVGDQQASMFGACCFKEYDINCTMGTGSFLNINTGLSPTASFNGVYPLVGWTISNQTTYMAECCVQDVGTMLSLAQNLDLFNHPNESSEIAQSVSGSDGIYFLPSAATLFQVVGRKSTNMSSVIGLKSQTSRGHIVRSILEALAFQIRLLYDIMKNYGVGKSDTFRICGGVSQNDFILQLVADLLEKPVIRLKNYECSSIGAAFLAGLYCGVWKNLEEIISLKTEFDKFYPNALSTEEYRNRYMHWKTCLYHPIVMANM